MAAAPATEYANADAWNGASGWPGYAEYGQAQPGANAWGQQWYGPYINQAAPLAQYSQPVNVYDTQPAERAAPEQQQQQHPAAPPLPRDDCSAPPPPPSEPSAPDALQVAGGVPAPPPGPFAPHLQEGAPPPEQPTAPMPVASAAMPDPSAAYGYYNYATYNAYPNAYTYPPYYAASAPDPQQQYAYWYPNSQAQDPSQAAPQGYPGYQGYGSMWPATSAPPAGLVPTHVHSDVNAYASAYSATQMSVDTTDGLRADSQASAVVPPPPPAPVAAPPLKPRPVARGKKPEIRIVTEYSSAARASSPRAPLGGVARPQAEPPAYVPVTSAPAPIPTLPSSLLPVHNSKVAASKPADQQKVPPALESYTQRAFRACRTDPERERVAGKLRSLIAEKKAAGELWSTDWDTMKLPALSSPVHPRLQAFDQEMSSDSPDSSESLLPPRISTSVGSKRAGAWMHHPHNTSPRHRKQPRRVLVAPPRKDSFDFDELDHEVSIVEQHKRAKREKRFAQNWDVRQERRATHKYSPATPVADASVYRSAAVDTVDTTVKGVCQDLEKDYFRLTSAPDPAKVRPPEVLARALKHVMQKLRSGVGDRMYFWHQFKSMRQDCTVQRVRNELAVQVYEAHARCALLFDDRAEYNQCLTQLAILYTQGRLGCVAEFTAYRILYHTIFASKGTRPLYTCLQNLPPTVVSSAEVQHALEVRKAVFQRSMKRFFRLYESAPHMGRLLLDELVPALRWQTLNALVKSHKLSALPVSFLARNLGFISQLGESERQQGGLGPAALLLGRKGVQAGGRFVPAPDEQEGLRTCTHWLEAHGVRFVASPAASSEPEVDCKASAGSLKIPEDNTRVAHGDTSLAVDDFLSANRK